MTIRLICLRIQKTQTWRVSWKKYLLKLNLRWGTFTIKARNWFCFNNHVLSELLNSCCLLLLFWPFQMKKQVTIGLQIFRMIPSICVIIQMVETYLHSCFIFLFFCFQSFVFFLQLFVELKRKEWVSERRGKIPCKLNQQNRTRSET